MTFQSENKKTLPIDSYLEEVQKVLEINPNVILSASPGSGKTTRVPYSLLNKFKKIIVLEPRRIAALAAAQRICEENNITLGDQVGYQVRFENKSNENTRLLFLTEALLLRKMLVDPQLIGIELIILDEFHERSQHVDLALGLIREMQLLGHPIKLLIMSATLHAEKISEYLDQAPIIEVPGSLYPLEIVYEKKPQSLRTHEEFRDRVIKSIKDFSIQSSHDTLVFLPGVGEILKIQNEISEWSKLHNFELQTLYSQMPLLEQKKVLIQSSKKRIILATNIAESALTIEGVGLVIDSGLERKVEFDEKSMSDRLVLQRISKSSAVQRAGRAARQFPGQVIRLWNKTDEYTFSDQTQAEINRVDLSYPLLALAAQGVSNFSQFTWYERPSAKKIQWAEEELKSIQALSQSGQITEVGLQILQIPAPPRICSMLLFAEKNCHDQKKDFNLLKSIAEVAAFMTERDISFPTTQFDHTECDAIARWLIYTQNPGLLPGRLTDTIVQVSRQFLSSMKKFSSQKTIHNTNNFIQKIENLNLDEIKFVIFSTFLDRLCRRRDESESGKAIKVGGRGVILDKKSLVRKSEFFIPLRSVEIEGQKETLVSWACGTDSNNIKKWFSDKIQKKTSIQFDSTRGKLLKTENLYLFDLAIDKEKVSDPSPKEIEDQWADVLISSWNWIIKNNPELNSWMNKFQYIQDFYKSQNSPEQNFIFDFSQKNITSICSQIALMCKKLSEIPELNLIYLVESEIPEDIQFEIKQYWPTVWKAPSGRTCPVNYVIGQNPYVEIKLQECFGLLIHPKIFPKNLKLSIHLLAPNQRPIQVTGDIESFWKGSYHDIRKELRARYPKHAWPEDPLTASAEQPKKRGH